MIYILYISVEFVKCGVLTLVSDIRHSQNDRYYYYIEMAPM